MTLKDLKLWKTEIMKIDEIVFGDNQFFGINHMSQEKASQQAKNFECLDDIFNVYNDAIFAGIKGIMLNSNDRAREICERFKNEPEKYGHLNFYPSIPYPHKYANLVSEKGIFVAIKEVLFSGENNSALKKIKSGTQAIIMKDAVKLMKMLVDLEIESFKGLNIRCIFLQNIVTDLLIGLDQKKLMIEYCDYIRNTHKTTPGLITQNLPALLTKLKEWEIENIIICTSLNKIGYLMSPNLESYIKCIKENDPTKYQIMAMSTLASGAIDAHEAYKFINSLEIQSVVFGASSKKNIDSTKNLINLKGN